MCEMPFMSTCLLQKSGETQYIADVDLNTATTYIYLHIV